MSDKPELTKEGFCSFCQADRPCCLTKGDVTICARCLQEAKKMAKAPPKVLSGVLSCKSCGSSSFAVEHVIYYNQMNDGTFEGDTADVPEDPDIWCTTCGSKPTPDQYHTIVSRILGTEEDDEFGDAGL